jgi:hypothetical protein
MKPLRVMCDIVRVRGDFDKLDWFRGFDSEDFMVAFNTASETLSTYACAMAVAGQK